MLLTLLHRNPVPGIVIRFNKNRGGDRFLAIGLSTLGQTLVSMSSYVLAILYFFKSVSVSVCVNSRAINVTVLEILLIERRGCLFVV